MTVQSALVSAAVLASGCLGSAAPERSAARESPPGCDASLCNQFCGARGGSCNAGGYCECNPPPSSGGCGCDLTCPDGTTRFCEPGTPGDCAQCATYDCSCPPPPDRCEHCRDECGIWGGSCDPGDGICHCTPAPGPPNCGNGTCDEGETRENCPDCAPGSCDHCNDECPGPGGWSCAWATGTCTCLGREDDADTDGTGDEDDGTGDDTGDEHDAMVDVEDTADDDGGWCGDGICDWGEDCGDDCGGSDDCDDGCC
jgi:hypothetical protein